MKSAVVLEMRGKHSFPAKCPFLSGSALAKILGAVFPDGADETSKRGDPSWRDFRIGGQKQFGGRIAGDEIVESRSVLRGFGAYGAPERAQVSQDAAFVEMSGPGLEPSRIPK